MGTVAEFLGIEQIAGAFHDMAGLVRKGGTLLDGEGTVSADNPIWVNFARTMAPLMAMPSELIAKMIGADSGEKWKVLDIAAGHGLFGIAFAKHNPNAQIGASPDPPSPQLPTANPRNTHLATHHS